MIRHIVLIRFRADVPEATISGIFADLHGLQGHLPGLLTITSGRSESPEQIERGYMHGFVSPIGRRWRIIRRTRITSVRGRRWWRMLLAGWTASWSSI